MPWVTVAPRSLEAFPSVCKLNGSREVFGCRVNEKRNMATPPFRNSSFTKMTESELSCAS
jgi:hypothetical protein